MDFWQTSSYQTCQALFDRAYPNFRNAGQVYQDLVGRYITASTRLLDLGSGRCSLAARQIQPAKLRVGIDPYLGDLACNEAIAHPAVALGENLPFRPATFDLIITQWVMEHLAFPQRVVSEMARVLRPGGRIVIFTTNWHNYIPRVSYLIPHRLQVQLVKRLLRRPERETFPVYYRANTRSDIAAIAGESGLEMRHCLHVGNPFYFAFSPALFRVALGFERLTDIPRWQDYKLYLLIVLQKSV